MNRIDAIFRDLRSRGGKALMPFVTAGDPDMATTAAILPAIEAAGASVCEIGIPFSDPIADGPVIQESMTYALDHGLRTAHVLESVAAVRSKVKLGLVAMVSYSIVHRIGPAAFMRDCKQAGFDGFIFPDLPLEESEAARDMASSMGLTSTLLIAPTTPLDRARKIAQVSTGFVYVVARAGITGERATLPEELPARLRELRQVTDLPIAVGFGVSRPEHVKQVVEIADAAIVGSAIVKRIGQHRSEGPAAIAKQIGDMVRDLARGLPAPV